MDALTAVAGMLMNTSSAARPLRDENVTEFAAKIKTKDEQIKKIK